MRVCRLAVVWLAALPLAGSAAAPPTADWTGEEDVFWRDVTLRLAGALPNAHPRLADHLELYLGRTDDGRWRRYVLGFSALFDPRDLSTKDHKHYNWMDHEGTLREVEERGESLHLAVDMTIHPDPWVCGGKVHVDIRLRRDGHKLTGTYEGHFDKAASDRAGPAGRKATAGKVTGAIRQAPWPRAVKGHVPLRRGEHPRLLFRSHDLPALKRRMAAPAGKVILSRLRKMLADETPSRQMWHGYGYGLMHQLTGERKWADAARKYAEGAVAGKVKYPRYGWYTRDGGYMRVGPSVAAVAAAYDMCYPAWDESFRTWLAGKIQGRIWPNFLHKPDLQETDGQFNQRSNHYMLYNGGGGMSLLAIRGDAGTDDAITARAHRIFLRRLKRGLVDGFGDHGWFYEGTFCGRFPTNGALSQYIQALRVAEGRDYVTGCSEAQWLCTKWIYEVVRSGGKLECFRRGMYRRIPWRRPEGDFALGFGILPELHKPAVLWAFRKVFEPGEKTYDTRGPKQAAYAFVNWPIGLEPKDPSDVLGHVLYDREASFFLFRSGWRGEGDVVISMWGDAVIRGMGLSGSFAVGIPPKAAVTHFGQSEGGKAIVVAARHAAPGAAGEPVLYSLAVDFTGLSGAPVLLAGVTAKPGQGGRAGAAPPAARRMSDKDRRELEALLGKTTGQASKRPGGRAPAAGKPAINHVQLRLGGRAVHLATVQKGPAPQPRLLGEGKDQRIVVGRRAIRFDGQRLVLGHEG